MANISSSPQFEGLLNVFSETINTVVGRESCSNGEILVHKSH